MSASMSTAATHASLRLGFPRIFGRPSCPVSSTSSTIPPADGPVCVRSRRQRRESGPLRGWFAGDFVDIVDGPACCVRIRRQYRWFRPQKPRFAGRTVDAHDGTGSDGRARGVEDREKQETLRPLAAGFPLEGQGASEKGMFSPPAGEAGWGDASPAPEGYGWGSLQDLLTRR